MPISQCVCMYVSIVMCRHLCWHLDISYLPVQEQMCWHICQAYISILVECADILRCWHIWQHLNVPGHMSASGHVNILVSAKTNVLTYMSAYFSPLAEYADISMCLHVCQYRDVSAFMLASGHFIFASTRANVLTYMPGIYFNTSRMCRHLKVLAYMAAS